MHPPKIEMVRAQAQAILTGGIVPALADGQGAFSGITSNIKSSYCVSNLLKHCIKILQQDNAKTN